MNETRAASTVGELGRLRRPVPALAVVATVVGLVHGACAAAPTPHLADLPYPPPTLTTRGTQVGLSSWYGPKFDGHRTASGERFDQRAMTAAHRTLPLGTWIDVTDRKTGRRVRVRVNDRGPYVRDRVLDLSRGAAEALGTLQRGVAEVEISVVSPRYKYWPSVRYGVQLGAFRNHREADRLARKAGSLDLPAYVRTTPEQRAVHRVRVGPYLLRSHAAEVAAYLGRRGFDPVIVEINPAPDTASR